MKNNKSMLLALTGMGMMLGLASCSGGGDGLDEPLAAQTQSVPVRMAATYSLSPTTDIPVPNDLLFGDSDLTLNFQPDDPDNFADPKVAMGALDGWSSISPLSISFHSNDSDLAIDPDTVVGGSTVHVYKVIVLREEALSGTGIILPTGPVTSVERELTANLEYVVLASSSTSIAILPTVPFEQQESYMVVVTNGLLDSDGLPVLNDSQYAIAKSRDAIDPDSSVGALEPVRQLVNAMEDAAAAEGVPHANIILSYQFTVQSMGTVLDSAKTLYIDTPLAAGETPFTSFSSLNIDTSDIELGGAADLYKGMIAIPYMLGVPSAANEEAPLNTFWIAVPELPLGPNGEMVPNPFGDNLTYANSYPKVNTVELAPLLVSMPKVANCPKPAAGYKVAIFQHGITGNRTNALGIVDALAASCTAVVSMDQPIHGISENNDLHLRVQEESDFAIGLFEGYTYTEDDPRERTFGIDFMDNTTGELGLGIDETPDPSGSWTINLSNLLVSRDNVRQAIFDLLLLEKAIASMDIDGDGDADFDSTNISFVGHSLGAMVGTGFIAYSDLIKTAALAFPGGAIAELLSNSDSFGPKIKAGVAASAGIDVTDSAFPDILASFNFAAQMVLDSGDPANYAAMVVTNDVPTLMLQVLDDTVVPNSAATAPLAGTEPLARLMGLSTVTTDTAGILEGNRLFTKLNMGNHGSVISPADGDNSMGLLNVTTEIQTQIVTFFATSGTKIQVVDPTLLDD